MPKIRAKINDELLDRKNYAGANMNQVDAFLRIRILPQDNTIEAK
jgi:hypothetical protein